jgi:hypothetical protein
MTTFNVKRTSLLAVAVFAVAAPAFAYTYSSTVTIGSTNDVTAANNSGALVLGTSTGKQVGLDNNEIQARDAGVAASLSLNAGGGDVNIGFGAGVVNMTNADRVRLPDMVDFGPSGFFMVGGVQALAFTSPTDGLDMDVTAGTAFWEQVVHHQVTHFNDRVYLANVPSAQGGSALCLAGQTLGTCSSSARFKENVADLDAGLDEVLKMNAVSFTWKEGGQADLGFIAEQAATVLPKLVAYDDAGQVRSFNYQHYTAVLTRAVQEQHAMFEDLRSEVLAEHGKRLAAEAALAQKGQELREQQAAVVSVRQELAQLAAQVAELRSLTSRSALPAPAR